MKIILKNSFAGNQEKRKSQRKGSKKKTLVNISAYYIHIFCTWNIYSVALKDFSQRTHLSGVCVLLKLSVNFREVLSLVAEK